jgi:anti-sigma B factor antagonist
MAARSRLPGRPRPADETPLRRALRPRGPVHCEVSERRESNAVVLRVDGEVDVLTAPKLAAQLNDLIRTSTDDLVLDLREAQFIDSAGLQILLGARRRLDHASRRLTVVCEEGPVKRVIELARLTETLSVTDRPPPPVNVP